ncbi:MAG: NADH-quinone oxidoreductase subunit H [Deltaproteobacteria bacterium]
MSGALHLLLFVVLAPFLAGVIRKTKSFFGCRRGPSLAQPYRDLAKLFRRGIVRSHVASRVLDLSGPVALGSALVLAAATPLWSTGVPLPLHFVLYLYLMALPRFFQALAGLDTGSSFGGLGASREVSISALAEPAFLLVLCAAAALAGGDLSGTLPLRTTPAAPGAPGWILPAAALFLLLLAENSRIPVDDPATHLELTMIHEAMVLDHAGIDLAMIQLASAIRLAVFSALLTGILFPGALALPPMLAIPAAAGRLALAGIAVGIVESATARLRLSRVVSYLLVANIFAAVAIAVRFVR